MTPTLQTAHDRLQQAREENLTELAHLTDAVEGYKPDFGMGEGDPGIVERERNMLLVDQVKERLAEIDAALARVADGSYGRCLECGEPINPERLEVLPFATLCISCASRPHRH